MTRKAVVEGVADAGAVKGTAKEEVVKEVADAAMEPAEQVAHRTVKSDPAGGVKSKSRAQTLPDLPFSNWMMFDRVMQDPDICAAFLEAVLEIEVGHLEYVQSEMPLEGRLGAKPVRLDVFARDGKRIYDVEMQARYEPDLGRRMRYYQGSMDVAEMDPGDSYKTLPDSYIIFLCLHDPFGRGLPVYTVRPTCVEDRDVAVGSGQAWVVLNASAWEEAPEGELREVLQYTQSGRVPEGSEGGIAAKIDGAVARANGEAAWKERSMGFMTLEHHWLARCEAAWEEGEAKGLAEGKAKGLAEGKAEGREQFARLADALLDAGRLDDLKRAASDEPFRDGLMRELGI